MTVSTAPLQHGEQARLAVALRGVALAGGPVIVVQGEQRRLLRDGFCLQADQDKLMRARNAEQMSLDFEVRRLAELGINRSPVWMSIEDNTAGYDIQSFDIGTEGPVTRLIEVKSTIASPLRFWLSRNEWETAKKFGAAYFFHIWDLQGPQLHERTVGAIEPHIPSDNERGRWANVQIPVVQGSA